MYFLLTFRCITTFEEQCSFVKFALKKQQENLFWRLSAKVFCRIVSYLNELREY